MSERATRRMRFTRDSVIVTFSLLAGAYEIVLGGGRVAVLTFITGLLLSPAVVRIDEALRRNSKED